MNTNDLKKSGIITVIITFTALAFWLGFSKLSLGAYNEQDLTKQFLKEDSEVFKTVVIEVGTDTVGRIIVGTSSMARVGTSSYPTQPRIEYNGATGIWSFKNSGGTQTAEFGTITGTYLAVNYATIASLNAYLLSAGGAGTSNTFNTPTLNSAQLAGSTTIGTGSTITAGSDPFDGTKVRFLADVTQNIEANINTKLTVIGTPTTYINMIQADGKTGTKSASFSAGSGMALTTTYQPDGALNFSYATSGSASAKPDIKEGGTITVTGAVFLNYNNADFDIAVNGLGADVDLSPTRKGTSTATASFTVAGGTDTGNLLKNWYNSGMVIGSAYGSTTVVTTTNAIIPDDATIPQNSEGSEIITVAYTPKQLGSTIHIQVIANVTPALSGVLTAAIFVDSVVGALCCAGYNKVSDDAISSPTVFSYSTTTASLATRTYKLRYGCSNASYIVYLNQGSVAGKTYGNIMLSSMHVYETKQ